MEDGAVTHGDQDAIKGLLADVFQDRGGKAPAPQLNLQSFAKIGGKMTLRGRIASLQAPQIFCVKRVEVHFFSG
jgi:hypothetical protein